MSLIERSVQQTKVSPKDEFVGLPQKDHLENKIPDLDLYDQNILSYDKDEVTTELLEDLLKDTD